MKPKVFKRDCTRAEWDKFITAMTSGQIFECDEEMFFYWLEILPPIFMHETIDYLPGYEGHPKKVSFGFAEGSGYIMVFWKSKGRFYGQQTKRRAEG